MLTAHIATDAVAPPERAGWRRLEVLPIGLFAFVMGLTGLSVAWNLAHVRCGSPAWIADGIGWVTIGASVAVALDYAAKIVIAPHAVWAEFHHPIAGNLFGTPLISLLLLPKPLAPMKLVLAQVQCTGSPHLSRNAN